MKKTPVLIKLIFSSRDINYMSGNEKYWGGGGGQANRAEEGRMARAAIVVRDSWVAGLRKNGYMSLCVLQ